MKKISNLSLFHNTTAKKSAASLIVVFLNASALSAQSVSNVFGFPSTEPGYSLGVSACYAGQIGDYLVMAGGCNFPTPGNKTYYAGIYAARIDATVLNWQLVGLLPEPAAYGATVTNGDSLLFIGGNNTEHSLKSVYSIHLNATGDKAEVHRLADLPCTIDNMAVATNSNDIYLSGGNQDGKPSVKVLHHNMVNGKGQWDVAAAVPGSPRVQPVSVASDGNVYVWGGFYVNGENSEVHTDGYCLNTTTGEWTALAAPRSIKGKETTLSGGIAWTDGKRVFATGGVNKDIFLDAISGRYEFVKKEDYLLQPIEWYKFSGNLYSFDAEDNKWLKTKYADKALARAGAVVVPTEIGTYYIGGELKPSVRTPQIVIVKE